MSIDKAQFRSRLAELKLELKCPICLSVLRNAHSLPCNHFYCMECLQRVLEVRSPQCPICKAPFKRRELVADPAIQEIVRQYRNLHELVQEDFELPMLTQMSQSQSNSPHGHEKSSVVRRRVLASTRERAARQKKLAADAEKKAARERKSAAKSASASASTVTAPLAARANAEISVAPSLPSFPSRPPLSSSSSSRATTADRDAAATSGRPIASSSSSGNARPVGPLETVLSCESTSSRHMRAPHDDDPAPSGRSGIGGFSAKFFEKEKARQLERSVSVLSVGDSSQHDEDGFLIPSQVSQLSMNSRKSPGRLVEEAIALAGGRSLKRQELKSRKMATTSVSASGSSPSSSSSCGKATSVRSSGNSQNLLLSPDQAPRGNERCEKFSQKEGHLKRSERNDDSARNSPKIDHDDPPNSDFLNDEMEAIEAEAERKVVEAQRRRDEAEQAVRDAERAQVARQALELQGDDTVERDSCSIGAPAREESMDGSDEQSTRPKVKDGTVCSSSSSGDDQAHDEVVCNAPSLPLEDSTPFTSETERLPSNGFESAAVGASVDREESVSKESESISHAPGASDNSRNQASAHKSKLAMPQSDSTFELSERQPTVALASAAASSNVASPSTPATVPFASANEVSATDHDKGTAPLASTSASSTSSASSQAAAAEDLRSRHRGGPARARRKKILSDSEHGDRGELSNDLSAAAFAAATAPPSLSLSPERGPSQQSPVSLSVPTSVVSMSSQSSPAALRPSVLFRGPPSPSTEKSGLALLVENEHLSRRSENKLPTDNGGNVPLVRSVSIASTSSLDPSSQDDGDVNVRSANFSNDGKSRLDGSKPRECKTAPSAASSSSISIESATRTPSIAAASSTNATRPSRLHEQPTGATSSSTRDRESANPPSTTSTTSNGSHSPSTAVHTPQQPQRSSASRAASSSSSSAAASSSAPSSSAASSAASSNPTDVAPNVTKRKLKRKSPPSHAPGQSEPDKAKVVAVAPSSSREKPSGGRQGTLDGFVTPSSALSSFKSPASLKGSQGSRSTPGSASSRRSLFMSRTEIPTQASDEATTGGVLVVEADDVCSVCRDPEGDSVVVFCDICGVCVHPACYGLEDVPGESDDWYCKRCAPVVAEAKDRLANSSSSSQRSKKRRKSAAVASSSDKLVFTADERTALADVKCCVCPNTDDQAFTNCVDGRWIHVSCAFWHSGPIFGDPVHLENVQNIEKIPKSHFWSRCAYCGLKSGAVLQCEIPTCYTTYHVPCAHRCGGGFELREAPSSDKENANPSSSSSAAGEDVIYFHNFCARHNTEKHRASVPDNNSDEKKRQQFVAEPLLSLENSRTPHTKRKLPREQSSSSKKRRYSDAGHLIVGGGGGDGHVVRGRKRARGEAAMTASQQRKASADSRSPFHVRSTNHLSPSNRPPPLPPVGDRGRSGQQPDAKKRKQQPPPPGSTKGRRCRRRVSAPPRTSASLVNERKTSQRRSRGSRAARFGSRLLPESESQALDAVMPQSKIPAESRVLCCTGLDEDQTVDVLSFLDEFGGSLQDVWRPRDPSTHHTSAENDTNSSNSGTSSSSSSSNTAKSTAASHDKPPSGGPYVTHVITHATRAKNFEMSSRTMKYFKGVANGVWIVGIDWISESLVSQQVLAEDGFEVQADPEGRGAPKAARVGRERSRPLVFSNLSAVLYGRWSKDALRCDIRELLLSAGAHAVERRIEPPPLPSDSDTSVRKSRRISTSSSTQEDRTDMDVTESTAEWFVDKKSPSKEERGKTPSLAPSASSAHQWVVIHDPSAHRKLETSLVDLCAAKKVKIKSFRWVLDSISSWKLTE